MARIDLRAGKPYIYRNAALTNASFTKVTFPAATRTIVVGQGGASDISFNGGTSYLIVPANTVLSIPVRTTEVWVKGDAASIAFGMYAELEDN